MEDRAIVEQLLVVLDEAMQGAAGDSTYFVDNRPDCGLVGSLAGLDAGSASALVAGTSIAAHVNHVVFAMKASADWITGDRAALDWRESWTLTKVDAADWLGLLDRLQRQYAALRSAIEAHDVAATGSLAEAAGAIAHIAYHLGVVREKSAVLRENAAGPGPARPAGWGPGD